MFQSTELRCISLCLICLATSFLAVELPVPIAHLLTRYHLALEKQTCRCLDRQTSIWQQDQLEQPPHQEVNMVAQQWLRPRLPSRNQREVR